MPADHKKIFIEKLEPLIISGRIKSICDLGSGLSKNFLWLIEKYPSLVYMGVEPSASAVAEATKLLLPYKNAKSVQSDGYHKLPGWGTFDLVISLSVLEHVKQLKRFLAESVNAARPGGMIVHRWDLGHALHPSSLKEKFQVWLGNHVPAVLPEQKFVRFLSPLTVQRALESHGAKIERVTYHQMPCHKSFIKNFDQSNPAAELLVRNLVEWEFEVSPYLDNMKEKTRLNFFPAVAVWSVK